MSASGRATVGGRRGGAAVQALLQRVTSARVDVAGEAIAAIHHGLLVLVGIEPGDGTAEVERMARRLLGYRVFADAQGRMNHNVVQAGGGLLLVSQFTLAADTRSGLRPGFSTAAPPEQAERSEERRVGKECSSGAGPG